MTIAKSRQLPSSQVASELGEVNVTNRPDGGLDVCCTILLEPSGADAELCFLDESYLKRLSARGGLF